MAASDIQGLTARMAKAAAEGDFETAAALRDALREAKGAMGADTQVRRQTPGAMGLGTDQPRRRAPAGWTPPSKPDLNTTGTRPRRGR